MRDLVSRLLAAIEETQRLAQAAHDEVACKRKALSEIGWAVTASTRIALPNWFKHANHQRPSAILRRCAADREIVDTCAFWLHENDAGIDPCARSVLNDLARGYGLSVEEETTQ